MLSCVVALFPEILVAAAFNNFFLFHRWSVFAFCLIYYFFKNTNCKI